MSVVIDTVPEVTAAWETEVSLPPAAQIVGAEYRKYFGPSFWAVIPRPMYHVMLRVLSTPGFPTARITRQLIFAREGNDVSDDYTFRAMLYGSDDRPTLYVFDKVG